MAAVGVGTKYHVALYGRGFLLRGRGYSKRDAPIFAPRLNTGEQGLGDLDLYKTWSKRDLRGLGGQTLEEDETKVDTITGGVDNPVDGSIFPAHNWLTNTVALPTNYVPTSKVHGYRSAVGGEEYYVATWNLTTMKWAVFKMNTTTTAWTKVVEYTLTSPGFSGRYSGGDMVVTGDLIYMSLGIDGLAIYNGTAWVRNTSGQPDKLGELGGVLYTSGAATSPTSAATNALFKYTGGSATTGGWTGIGQVGERYSDIVAFCEYNHRLYMSKEEGLFVYDTAAIRVVLPGHNDFFYMAAHEGYLYCDYQGSFARYNGSTLEIVQRLDRRVSGIGRIQSLGDRIVYAYNGYFWIYRDGRGSIAWLPSAQYIGIVASRDYVFSSNLNHEIKFYDTSASVEFGDAGTLSPQTLTVRSSIFDAGFPNVDKYLDSVLVEYQDLEASDTIVIKYRLYSGTSWGSWQTLGTVTTATSNQLFLKDTPALTGVGKKLQIELVMTHATSSQASLLGFAADYILQPKYKREWVITLVTQGTSDNPLPLGDDETEEELASTLREAVYDARASTTPVDFEDIDFARSIASSSITAVQNAIYTDYGGPGIGSITDGFPEAGYIKIDDEIIKYTSKNLNTFSGCTRGALGTTAATHSASSLINSYYRVVVAEIQNESVVIPNQDLVAGQESEMTLVLREA